MIISRSSYLIFFIVFCWTFGLNQGFAQKDKWRFFWNVDEEYNEDAKVHLGIHFNYYNSHYFFEKNENWNNLPFPAQNGQFTSISAPAGHGIGLGIPMDYRINKRFNLTLSPTFVVTQGSYNSASPGSGGMTFSGQNLVYTYANGPEEVKMHTAEISNFPAFEIPLHLKLRSDSKYFNGNSSNTYKLYLLAGGKWTNTFIKDHYTGVINDYVTNANSRDLPLFVKKNHFSFDVGLGLDLKFTYFKLSPEIRFSQSVGNLMNTKLIEDHQINHPYMAALNRLGLRSFQFSLIFE